jgi:hypothetical protein
MVSGSAPLLDDYVSNDHTARASGIIVDTPSSFASSPSSSSTPDHRQTLIRACVDAFRSKLSQKHFRMSCSLGRRSQRDPRRGPRETEC